MSQENMTKSVLEGTLEIKSQQEIARAEELLRRLRPKSIVGALTMYVVTMVLAGVAYFYAEQGSVRQTIALVMFFGFTLLFRSEIDNRRTNKRIDALWSLIQKNKN